ncbi:hypothetical protein D9M72_364160 [compost metagenome]
MAQMLGRFHAHVHQDLVEGHVPAFLRPPRHFAGGVQRQCVNGGVAVLGGEPMEFNDLLAGFLRTSPHVGVGFCVLSIPRQVPRTRAPEDLAEISELHAGHVLHQAQEVGAGRR